MAEISEEKRVEIESWQEINASLPKVVVYAFAMVLIWAFAMYVYGPIGKGLMVGGFAAGDVIQAIAVIALLILVAMIWKEINDICDAVGGLIAAKSERSGASAEEVKDWRTGIKGIVFSIILALIFMLFGSLLKAAGLEAIAGIVLIVVFLFVVFLLYRSVMAINRELAAATKEKTQKMLEAAEKEAEKKEKAKSVKKE